MDKKFKPGIGYRLFKAYVGFWNNKIFYRNYYKINTQALLPDGVAQLIVSNHQNSLNDALGIIFAFEGRKPNFITRGDVFELHPIIKRFLYWLGLLPSYRLQHEGAASLSKNKAIFDKAGRALIDGHSVAIYPEAGHQDKRWLGTFSFGFTRLAFDAALMENFEREVFILPSCNHYSDYVEPRADMLVKFGTPISLKPFYELYQTKPRTAQRQVCALVRAQIEDMMLNITDLDNYESIDFIRNTFGVDFAAQQGFDAEKLPEKLLADKRLVAELAAAKTADASAIQSIYDDAKRVAAYVKAQKIDDRSFSKKPNSFVLIVKSLLLLAFSPLFVFALWPNALNFIAPNYFVRKTKDIMFYSSFLVALSVLVTIPIFYTLTFVLTGCLLSWWVAVVYILILPLLALFGLDYRNCFVATMKKWRFLKLKSSKSVEFKTIEALRASLHARLKALLSKSEKK